MGSGASKKAAGVQVVQEAHNPAKKETKDQESKSEGRKIQVHEVGSSSASAKPAKPAASHEARPLSQAKVENEEVEEAMAKAIGLANCASPEEPEVVKRQPEASAAISAQPAQAAKRLAPEELPKACREGNLDFIRAFLQEHPEGLENQVEALRLSSAL